MIRVGLARGPTSYAGLTPPFSPGALYPELAHAPRLAAAGTANGVYASVRAALLGLGLDADRFGTPAWNPLGDLVHEGGTIVVKPNFIRHWNPLGESGENGSTESVITHGSVLRAALDYAFLAAGPSGRVIVAEAPQQDCDFEVIRRLAGLDALCALYRDALGADLQVIDLRREAVTFENGVIVSRTPLPGDPMGYRSVDLGQRSFFESSGLDPHRFRGADYDPGPTSQHHSGGRNAYLLSETVLASDLVVNLPKLKTHKKTGVTLALKNLVGINGDKNWLPHHSSGSPGEGGDEFPGGRMADRARSRLADLGRQMLKRGLGRRLAQTWRRAEIATRGDDFIRSGNWHGNRTTWRMCADLNRCLYYSDASGPHFEAGLPVHRVLTVLDGIVCGEGNGPLAPHDVPLGVIVAGTDPVGVDLVAIRLMGFDERRIPKVWESMRSDDLRITAVREIGDVEVGEVDCSAARTGSPVDDPHPVRLCGVEEIDSARLFEPHPGWLNHIERHSDGSDEEPRNSFQRARA